MKEQLREVQDKKQNDYSITRVRLKGEGQRGSTALLTLGLSLREKIWADELLPAVSSNLLLTSGHKHEWRGST